MMIPAALNSMIRADGSPRYAMISMVVGAVINTILDPVFIFVFHMGVRGAAIATVLGQAASFVVSAAYLPRFKSLRLSPGALRPRWKTCGSILTFGIFFAPFFFPKKKGGTALPDDASNQAQKAA